MKKNEIEMSTNEIVAENFKNNLKMSGKSQKDYALEHNLDPTTVSKWINNKQPMAVSDIKDAANTFGLTMNDFCYSQHEKKRIHVKNSEYHPSMAQQSVETRLFNDELRKPFRSIFIVLFAFLLSFMFALIFIKFSPFWSFLIFNGFIYLFSYIKKDFGTKKTFIINYLDDIYYYRENPKNSNFKIMLIMHLLSGLLIFIVMCLFALLYKDNNDTLTAINMCVSLFGLPINIITYLGVNKRYSKVMYHNEIIGYKLSLFNLFACLTIFFFSLLQFSICISNSWHIVIISIIPLILAVFEFKLTCKNYSQYRLVYQNDGGKREELFSK